MPTYTVGAFYAAIICKFLTSIFHTVLLFIVVFTISRNELEKKTKSLIYRFIVYLISMTIAQGIDGFRNLLYGVDISSDEVVAAMLWVTRIIFQMIGFFIWYSIVFYQVRSVFDATYFQIKKHTIWIHKGIIVILTIIAFPVMYAMISQNWIVFTISLVLVVLFLGCGYCHLIFLFNRKLYQMVKHQSKSTDTSTQGSY